MKLRLPLLVFLTIALTSLIGALSMAAGLSVNLKRGFSDYLIARDYEQLDGLVQEIEARARTQRDTHPEGAKSVTLAPLLPFANPPPGPRRRPPPPHNSRDRIPTNHHRPPEGFDARLIALDPNGQRIAGPPLPLERVVRVKIISQDIFLDDLKIGTLQILPRVPTSNNIDASFLKRQNQTSRHLVLALLVLSLLPAWFMARIGKKLVGGMKEATDDIISGAYQKRAPDSAIREIADVTGNINALAESMKRLETTRRKWLAEISHELRTPLAAMTAEIDALADGVRPYSVAAIASLKEEANNLGRLMNDLHFLAISDLSTPQCTFEPLNPVRLCQHSINQFQTKADEAGLTLEFIDKIDKSVQAKWDQGRIDQVLSNIITNSLRYTDAPGKILLSIEQSHTDLILILEDSSPSVSPEDMAQLFEPLFRADSTRNRATGGTGLGLSVTSTIIHAHKGTFHAQISALGGLKLTITLPSNPDAS